MHEEDTRCRSLSSPTRPRRACQLPTIFHDADLESRRKDQQSVFRFARPIPPRPTRRTSRNFLETAVSIAEELDWLPVALKWTKRGTASSPSAAVGRFSPTQLSASRLYRNCGAIYAGSVETMASPTPCSRACSTARQASMAHLTRSGKLRTHLITRRSPSFFGASFVSFVTKSWNAWSISSTSSRLLPFNFIVINDADAWLIAQPRPVNLMSCKPPLVSNFTARLISSPQAGLSPCTRTAASGSSPKFRGRRE